MDDINAERAIQILLDKKDNPGEPWTSDETRALWRLEDLVNNLKLLTRYDQVQGGGCECCGSWVESEENKYGDWVKHYDIEKLLASTGPA